MTEIETLMKEKEELIDKLTDAEKQIKDSKETLDKIRKESDDKEIETFVDALVKEGKVLPKERDSVITVMQSLDNESKTHKYTIDDGKGKKTEMEITARELYMEGLKSRPNMVELEKERSLASSAKRYGKSTIRSIDDTPIDDEEIADRADEIVREYNTRGEKIGYREAVTIAYSQLEEER